MSINIVAPDGSMQDTVNTLFRQAGLPVTIKKKRTKEGRVNSVNWIERVVFQRPQEIPHYLLHDLFVVAIVGEDWISNWGYEFPVLLKLPVGRGGNNAVRIVLAVRDDSDIRSVEDLPQDCEIATEYVQLVERFLREQGREDISILPSYGNTEHKINFGATAIVDVTESGDSLRENGLRIIHTIMESNTVVVANPRALEDKSKKRYIDYFTRFINGAFQASYYAMLVANVPQEVQREAAAIIGGLKGPSCSPMTGMEGWVALQSVVPREDAQEIIANLLDIGVTDIIVNRNIPMIMS